MELGHTVLYLCKFIEMQQNKSLNVLYSKLSGQNDISTLITINPVVTALLNRDQLKELTFIYTGIKKRNKIK